VNVKPRTRIEIESEPHRPSIKGTKVRIVTKAIIIITYDRTIQAGKKFCYDSPRCRWRSFVTGQGSGNPRCREVNCIPRHKDLAALRPSRLVGLIFNTEMTRPLTATHCNTLQHTAPHTVEHCNTLYHTHCYTLQHSATYCNTQQHTVTYTGTHYTTLQHIMTRFYSSAFLCSRCVPRKSSLQVYHVAKCCSVLQCAAVCCIVPLWVQVYHVPNAAHCNTLQHTAKHCSTLQHTATHCNARI